VRKPLNLIKPAGFRLAKGPEEHKNFASRRSSQRTRNDAAPALLVPTYAIKPATVVSVSDAPLAACLTYPLALAPAYALLAPKNSRAEDASDR
jgi:hypothetical protein